MLIVSVSFWCYIALFFILFKPYMCLAFHFYCRNGNIFPDNQQIIIHSENSLKHQDGKCSWAGHARVVQLFPWRGEGCAVEGGMWEESVDRAGISDPADGAARSEAWLPRQRTSVSGRLNGCLNTQRCVNKGQLTPRRQEGANVYSSSVTRFDGNIKLQSGILQIILIPLCQC